MSETVNTLTHTNVICVSIPYRDGRKVLNQIIYEINCDIFQAIQSSYGETYFIDSNRFLNKRNFGLRGLHLNKSGKFKVSKNIANIINKTEEMNDDLNTRNENAFINFGNLIEIIQVSDAETVNIDNSCQQLEQSQDVVCSEMHVIRAPTRSNLMSDSDNLEKVNLYPTLPTLSNKDNPFLGI